MKLALPSQKVSKLYTALITAGAFLGETRRTTSTFSTSPGLLDAFNYVGTLAAFGFIVPYVLLSLVIAGVFFVFVTYVMVQATHGYSTPLDQVDAPLNVLAQLAGMPILQAPLSAAAMVSFFALCLSCINAGGRMIYAIGRHGLFHAATAATHDANETPHIAVTLMGSAAFLVACGMAAS